MIKTAILAAGLIVAAMHPATAKDRDSDGDVISVLPPAEFYRDSDGNVISVLKVEIVWLDDSAVYALETQDGTQYEAVVNVNADGVANLPEQVLLDGVRYTVDVDGDNIALRRTNRINPVPFELE